jgi:ferritin
MTPLSPHMGRRRDTKRMDDVAEASKIPESVRAELDRQVTHELHAALSYQAMQRWCEAAVYHGFAAFFAKQAGEEREHADRIMKHMVDRGAVPRIGAMKPPRADFASVMEVALQAQQMELANTAGIHAAYEAAIAAKDYPAQVMLQWFVSEQVEEEAWTDDLIEHVKRANCAGAMTQLDRHIVKMLAPDEGGD